MKALKPRLFRLYMRTHPDVLNSCSTWRVECQWCSTRLRGVLGGGSFKWTCREPCFHTTGAELPPSRLIIPIHTSNCLAGKTVPAIVDGVVRTSEVGHYSWCSAKGLRGARRGEAEYFVAFLSALDIARGSGHCIGAVISIKNSVRPPPPITAPAERIDTLGKTPRTIYDLQNADVFG